MTSLLVVCLHVVFDTVFGWTLLSLHPHDRSPAETLLLSVLLGMYVETISAATLMFLGIPLVAAGIATAGGMGALTVTAFYWGRMHRPRLSFEWPKWYEWVLLTAVGEKVLFAAWQLIRTPTYFEDALAHWSGRARSLFGGVNWSVDAASPVFLAGYIGYNSYPLQTIIWRALSAKLNGAWTEIISRADGLIFFLVTAGTIWLAVKRFSNIRWLAAAAAFVVSAVPLQVWHAAAGYSDIAVQAFLVAALAAILRKEWVLGGVMAAGSLWSKNDGLVLYVPSLLVACALLQYPQDKGRTGWNNVGRFLLGLATVAPWLIFNYVHRLGIRPGRNVVTWHSDAPALLWEALMKSPTSSILWIAIFAGVAACCLSMFKDTAGRALIFAFSISLGSILFVFTSTNAYQFLVDETTIHRVMLQFSAMAILTVTYGLSLKAGSIDPAVRNISKRRAACIKN